MFDVVAQTVARFGRLDGLVDNAQTFRPVMPLETVTSRDMDTLLDTGLKATLWGMQAVLPHFHAQGIGRIVNMGSVVGIRGAEGLRAVRGFQGGDPRVDHAWRRWNGLRRDRRQLRVSRIGRPPRPARRRPGAAGPTSTPRTGTIRWDREATPPTTSARSCASCSRPSAGT